MNRLVFLLVCVGLACGSTRAADPPPTEVKTAALNVILVGVDLYNSGNQEGCYRLYEGALIAIKPTLNSRPDLAAVIADRMNKAQSLSSVGEKAFALREALDVLSGSGSAKKPLWDRLGGQPAVEAVVHDFVVAAAPDPKVNFLRSGAFQLDAAGVKKLERRLVELVSAVSGGPLPYTGRDMKSTHAGMKITDTEFDALAGHLVATLKKYKVPQAELDELVGIVAGTRKDIVESAATKKALWDRLGGEAGVRAVLKEFVANAAKDPKANLDRNGNYPLTAERGARVEQLLVEQISSLTGGPFKYTGRDMKNTHAGMKITQSEFNAAAGHLVAALKKYKVPQTEIDELVAIIATTAKDMVEVNR